MRRGRGLAVQAVYGRRPMKRLDKPQKVALLCGDDIIRDPKTGRLVRLIDRQDEAYGYQYFNVVDLDTGERTAIRLRTSSRLVVWTD